MGLASPHSCPNTHLSVSVSPGTAEGDSPTHSPVPIREPGLSHPHSGAQRNGGRSRCARGAARRKRSLSRILPLPASGRHCGLMRHVAVKNGSGTRQKRYKEAAAAPGQQREPRGAPLRAALQPAAPRAPPSPPGTLAELKQLYLRGGGEGEAASPPLPPLPQLSLASPAPSTRRAVTSIL